MDKLQEVRELLKYSPFQLREDFIMDLLRDLKFENKKYLFEVLLETINKLVKKDESKNEVFNFGGDDV